jgi:hypothetical protein
MEQEAQAETEPINAEKTQTWMSCGSSFVEEQYEPINKL